MDKEQRMTCRIGVKRIDSYENIYIQTGVKRTGVKRTDSYEKYIQTAVKRTAARWMKSRIGVERTGGKVDDKHVRSQENRSKRKTRRTGEKIKVKSRK